MKKYILSIDQGTTSTRSMIFDSQFQIISKDQKEFLVIELKRGRASDRVVGQIQRYMGYVKDEIANNDQTVKGLIIALEDDLSIRRALSINPNIEFYRYKISFDLISND